MTAAHQSPSVDPRLIQWLAVQALHDRDARLVDGGGEVDDRIELARLFIDLPVLFVLRGPQRRPEQTTGMAAFLGALSGDTHGPRVLLVGGPGSGKSTITTMLAQALRLPWIDAHSATLSNSLRTTWEHARNGLKDLAAERNWPSTGDTFPVRVNLPSLARWMASHHDTVAPTLWAHLASRMSDELAAHTLSGDVAPEVLEGLVHDAGPVVWILDGLDEVPRTAGRAEVIEVVRAAVCARSTKVAGIVVTTRPQGYEGEFDELEAMTLLPLPTALSLEYGERLVRAWAVRGGAADLTTRLDKLRQEFAKPEVAVLLQTPLHTTIAAVLVAGRGTLPKSRYQLFRDYFTTVLRRELSKPIEHGVNDDDDGVIRALHAQAGMLLHTRAQAQPGARASLRRKELRAILAAIYAGLGYRGEEQRGKVERMLRFAAERLVLLIHDVEGEYTFGVRSLQEFFAAEALHGDAADKIADAERRMDAVVRASHWGNVVAFVVSRCALVTGLHERERALRLTVERCKALNNGDGGEAAARCLLGSHLALAMLRETVGYASPWLHEPLWEIAFTAATEPAQMASARAVERERQRGRARHETWWDAEEIHVRLGLTAAYQTGESGERWRRQVLDASATMFSRGDDDALVAWRLLHGLLLVGDNGAEQLAHRYAPTTETTAWAAADAGALIGEYVLSAWWCEYLNKHPEWFTPGQLWRRVIGLDSQRPVAALEVQKALEGESMAVELTSEDYGVTPLWRCIDPRPSLPSQMPDVSQAWHVWSVVAKFFREPSHHALAELIETLAQNEALQELRACVEYLSWPIAASVEFVAVRGNAIELARTMREGGLGNIDDWHAAEARWRASDVVCREELEAMFAAKLPWPRSVEAQGIPIPSVIQPRIQQSGDERTFETAIETWLQSQPERPELALRLLTTLGGYSASLHIHQLLDERPVDIHFGIWCRVLAWMGVDLESQDREGWIALLDARGRRGLNARWDDDAPIQRNRTLLNGLLQRFCERPDQWGLLDAITSLSGAMSSVDRDGLVLPKLSTDAPPRAHAQLALVALCVGHFDEPDLPSFLARLTWNDGAAHDLRVELAAALRARNSHDEATTKLLLTALDAIPLPTIYARDALLGALFERARRLPTPAFATREAWTQCALPEPYLVGQASPRRPPVLLSIDILRNVRLFAETPTVDVPFLRPPGDRGQWIVLVGQNGVGKTTLLRALALALADPAVASKLLDERIPLVRNGQEARVKVTLDSGSREIVIRRGERTDTIDAIVHHEGDLPWVVGYGVRRGNALGEKDRATEVGAVGELHTLFERPAALYPAAQWLRDLDGDVLREQRRPPRAEGAPPGPREAVWRAVLHALQTLLGVTKVEVEEGGAVYVTHPELGRVPFEAMSDGYLGTAGWLIDMVARWIERQRELDEPVGANVLRQMCGIALLDEIDLHLHPVWQLRIIDDVRRLFPRMSFVVTTHNPLALQGARAGEIYVMRRDGSRIELAQRDIRPGHDIDRVLLDQFGVEHTLDQATRDLLAEHRRLVERGVAFDSPDRRRVEARIIERFGDVGATLRDERAAVDSSPLRPDEQGLIDELLKSP